MIIEIHNAIVKSASLDDAERGFLTGWFQLDYGNREQGFGGHCLYLPKGFTHHEIASFAGHFIWRSMEICGVSCWKDIPGKSVRVRVEKGLAVAIGHIIKDDWFFPAHDFDTKEK